MMTRAAPVSAAEPVVFLPGSRGEDALAQYWLRQVTLRLRREVCWLWRERPLQASESATAPATQPPFVDRALEALDLARYDRDKRSFFTTDATAVHLGERIAAPPPAAATAMRGSFAWVAQTLGLTPVECFVLATALLPAVDSAAGSVIATCLNDPVRTEPTFGLAQRLWDEPDELIRCFDPAHALMRHGLLVVHGQSDWNAALSVPPLVARELVFPGREPPTALTPVAPLDVDDAGIMARAAQRAGERLIVPLVGAPGAPLAATAAAYAKAAGSDLVQPSSALGREHLAPVLTTAWLRGTAVYLPAALLTDNRAHDAAVEPPPLPGLPLTLFIGAHDASPLRNLGGQASPPVHLPSLSYAERLACWRRTLPACANHPMLPELARRFRYERGDIERVGTTLAALGRTPTGDDMLRAARGELAIDTLAQPVTPRFSLDELMLPTPQTRQIGDIVTAMNNLTRVHYEWGTARAWNEGGLTALFAGPSGTGKTMAAEAIASALKLPLYRIDLSQVVNKYIGETEKNLRRLFDAADSADVILFFDEADALFGKRTEVKDSHDRYANLEISYLLERMERFKGIAILATNRKRDLDEAFLRRLRFLVDFPLPGPEERLRIWRAVIPPGVDASALDLPFLAQRFSLAGGHIRAIVFHACLHSAADGAPRALAMPAVIRCVQREYEKLDRASSLEQFGPYAPLVAAERTRP
jgi:hypothetical protein